MLSKDTLQKIKDSGTRRVFVQAPEGLKARLLEIGSELESAGVEAVLSCEPCFGACDLRDAEAKRLGCELLLHIGHSDFCIKTGLPVIYDEYRMDADVEGLLEKNMPCLDGFKTIGFLATVQHVHLLETAKSALEKFGRKVVIGKPSKAGHAGQVLGCDQGAAKSVEGKVDAFVFIGTGRFHAAGIAAAVEKPLFFLDLESGSMAGMDDERRKVLMKKAASVEKARECRSFGVLVSTKPGQANLAAAEDARRRLEAKGRNAWILAMDAITPEKLLGLKLDCLVNCACTRLSEDAGQFRKPIISPGDVDKI
jgi:2-(3-amino-3-carboxypropyl)histidine synthase